MLNERYIGRQFFGALWRITWQEIGGRFWVYPTVMVAVIVFATVMTYVSPNSLSSGTVPLLRAWSRHVVTVGSTRWVLADLMLMGVGPYLVGVATALSGAMNTLGLFAEKTMTARLEWFLSAPISTGEFLLSVLGTALGLTLASWGILATVLAMFVLILSQLNALVVQVPASWWVLISLMPLTLGLWSSLIALPLGILFPGLSRLRTGSGNILQLLAVLPAISALVWGTTQTHTSLGHVAWIVSGLSLIATVVTLVVILRVFKTRTIFLRQE
ncbi:hypothetical protein [Sulfobacillus harzensis]|jgi:hypothetical protein|uniref:ABC-2 type transporter domain-containing protein n=1 Tax=Sulfobacillus harzensis TaxID=2729629 RepID=A0A7Y0Q4E3_9FIRM|nr:hypothetical protein [Sulfobacillus harzensis]NMP24335.1 hypothetical protein [Sulfobacillus harzensis]